jgi:cellulose synthase/poly-beta-1,6-N-acetylglucosamine synthase-like glycosyltransferase
LNGCKDATADCVAQEQENFSGLKMIDIVDAGKGLAIREGFKDALTRDNHLIGFVDADMATEPQYFYALIESLADDQAAGAIASRYMRGSQIFPPRPRIKRWGSKLIYENLVTLLLGMRYHDYQCGAKLFRREALEHIVPHLSVVQWACDVELLYLCRRTKQPLLEIPTVWYDKAGSKLKLSSGFKMLTALFGIRRRHKNVA